jgi:hypothetical protein
LIIGSEAGATSMVAVDSHRVVMVGGCGGVNEEDTVFVFDAVSDTLVGALPTFRDPTGMCWSPLTDLVYATAQFSDRLAVVQGDGSRIRKFFRVGKGPFVLLTVARHERTYVGHLTGGHVYVVRDRAGGIAEAPEPERAEPMSGATIVRDVLVWSATTPSLRNVGQSGDRPSSGGTVPVLLLDASGRKVMELAPGPNDVRGLAPGVYFATPHPYPLPQGAREQRQAVRKVLLTD